MRRDCLTVRRSGVRVALAAAFALSAGSSARCEDATLKDAYKGAFHVGVAITRTIPTGKSVRADNVNRTVEQVHRDASLVIKQFNQISPENDLKWALVHPKEGADGYDWTPADAYVAFGEKHGMYIVGHTLVWHGQT